MARGLIVGTADIEVGALEDIQAGLMPGHSIRHITGHSDAVDDTLSDVFHTGGIMPWLTSSVTIEAISDSADDILAGDGARVITINGLDDDFNPVSVDLNMNGLSASVASTQTFRRIEAAFVKESGQYGSTITGGNFGTIAVRTSGGGEDHLAIENGILSMGRSQKAALTVPAGFTAFILTLFAQPESNKPLSVFWWCRDRADIIAAPFSAKKLIFRADGLVVPEPFQPRSPFPACPEKSDIWASAVGTPASGMLSVDIEVLVIDNRHLTDC